MNTNTFVLFIFQADHLIHQIMNKMEEMEEEQEEEEEEVKDKLQILVR